MKKITGELNIKYEWWREGGKNIGPSLIPYLKDLAISTAKDQIRNGYTEGQLIESFYNAKKRHIDEYRGYWEVKET